MIIDVYIYNIHIFYICIYLCWAIYTFSCQKNKSTCPGHTGIDWPSPIFATISHSQSGDAFPGCSDEHDQWCGWIAFELGSPNILYIYIYIIIIYNCLYIYIAFSHTHAHSAYRDIDVCNPKSQTCTFWYVPLIGPWILGCVEAPGDWPEHDQRTSEPYQCAWGQGASECEGSPCNPSARVHKYEKSIGRSLE